MSKSYVGKPTESRASADNTAARRAKPRSGQPAHYVRTPAPPPTPEDAPSQILATPGFALQTPFTHFNITPPRSYIHRDLLSLDTLQGQGERPPTQHQSSALLIPLLFLSFFLLFSFDV